jgi:hypothetical protein
MQKIPTIFDRDWDGTPSLVTTERNPECRWVFDGEGAATVKFDGMCCAVINGELYKRREIKSGKPVPLDLKDHHTDPKTGKTIGWMPVGDGAEDKYFVEAWEQGPLPDGTYELVGPKSQGGIEKAFSKHFLVPHGKQTFAEDPPRDFYGLKSWLEGRDIEGIVFHHPDGRMAKIKLKDFGLERATQ